MNTQISKWIEKLFIILKKEQVNYGMNQSLGDSKFFVDKKLNMKTVSEKFQWMNTLVIQKPINQWISKKLINK